MAQATELELTPSAIVPPSGAPSEREAERTGVQWPTESMRPPVNVPSASPLDLPTDIFEEGLARRRQNRAAILGWIRESLVEGTDYGRIHVASREICPYAKRGEPGQCPIVGHWTKPSLFKPGAEKICGMLGVTAHYPNLPAYEQAALAGRRLETIVLRCELRDSQGRTVAEGIGARNVQQDYGDLNKSLKMAGKSAHIDATLRMAGLSEIFTQDLEDMRIGAASKPDDRPEVRDADENKAPPESHGVGVSGGQIKHLEGRIKVLGLDRERVLRWVRNASKDKVHGFEELTPEIYDRVLSKLDEWAKPEGGQDAETRRVG